MKYLDFKSIEHFEQLYACQALRERTTLRLVQCQKILEKHNWNSNLALEEALSLNKQRKLIMTIEEQVELSNLKIVLNDQFIYKRLEQSGKLSYLIKRYSELIDNFLETYNTPEDSVNNSLKN